MDSNQIPGPSNANFSGGGGDPPNSKRVPKRKSSSPSKAPPSKAPTPSNDNPNDCDQEDMGTFDGSDLKTLSTSDSDDREPDSIPPISIHRINFTPSAHDKSQCQDEEAKVIDDIMKKIKARNPHWGDHQYKEIHFGKLVDVVIQKQGKKHSKIQLESSGPEEDFKTRLYVKQRFYPHPLIVYFGGPHRPEKTSSLNIIWFLYRHDDIFALTTDSARHAIQSFIDYSFQSKIASRLGSVEGPKTKVEKVLAGNIELMLKLMKRAEGSGKVTDSPLLCKNFTAALKPNASLFRLEPFRGSVMKQQIWMTFGFGSIRIEKRIKIPHFQSILNHLSLIHRGQPTFSSRENSWEREEDTSVYDKDFTMVHPGLCQDLDNDLIDRVQQSLIFRVNKFRSNRSSFLCPQDEENDPLTCFDFSYVYDDEQFFSTNSAAYTTTTKFNIEFDLKKKKLDLPLNPTLSQVLDIVAQNPNQFFGSSLDFNKYLDTDNIQGFSWFIKHRIKLNGRFMEKKKKLKNPAQNFFACLEGEMIHANGGNFYWRVQNLWCSVNPNFFISFHQWFATFLRETLILDQNEHKLGLSWPKRRTRHCRDLDDIQGYVNLYVILPHKSAGVYCRSPNNCGRLCDLVHFDLDSRQIIFYFISTNFVTQTKHICGRIYHCRDKLVQATKYLDTMSSKNIQSYQTDHADYFKNLYDLLFKKFEAKNKKLGSYTKFLKSLSKATLIYALAQTDPQQDTASLARDSRLPVVVTQVMLEAYLKNFGDTALLLVVHSLFAKGGNKCGDKLTENEFKLIVDKFLEDMESQNYTQNNGLVTAKLIYAEFKNFDLPTLTQLCQEKVPVSVTQEAFQGFKKYLYNFFEQFKPSFKSLGARLELRELKNQSTLCQSEIQIKMCQILSSTD